MADFQIQDITIWMIGLAIFNYAIIFRRNRFFGSIGYLLIGILLYGVRQEMGYSETVYGLIALFIMAGALMNLIYEAVQMLWRGKGKKFGARRK